MSQLDRVLVVEDETDVRELMLLHLKREGYDASGVEDGEKARELLRKNEYDLAVLDWMLPGISGLDLCKEVHGKVPVLMVTARVDSSDIVRGLDAGADDYVTKPFEIPVFLARVRAILRRGNPPQTSGLLTVGELSIDLDRIDVRCGGQTVHLTASEFKLLAALVMNRGRVLSREKLIELVQGQGVTVVDRAIDTHVFGLRKKLGECADVVETIRGVGYRVKAE